MKEQNKSIFSSKKKKNDEDHLCLRALDWVLFWILDEKEGKVKVNETKNSIEFDGFSDPLWFFFYSCVVFSKHIFLGKDVLRSASSIAC